MLIWRRMRIKNFYYYFLIITIYVIGYRYFLFQKTPFYALNEYNLPMPLAFIKGQFLWSSAGMGEPAMPNIMNWFFFGIQLLTFNKLLLYEKIAGSAGLFASLSMFYFLSNHITSSKLSAFVSALIYGVGPAVILDFSDSLLWGYAVLPLLFHFWLNILSYKAKWNDSVALGFLLSIFLAFLPQLWQIILFLMLLLLLANLLNKKDIRYMKYIAKNLLISFTVLILTGPQIITGLQMILELTNVVNFGITKLNLPTTVSPITYKNQTFVNSFRLIGGDPVNHLSYSSLLGYFLPMFSFSSLLFLRNQKPNLRGIIISMNLISLCVIGIIFGVHIKANWALWLWYHADIFLWYYPERAYYVVSFSYSILVCLTLTKIANDVKRIGESKNKGIIANIIIILIIMSFAAMVFSFAPFYNIRLQQERSLSLPKNYIEINEWLTKNGGYGGTFRVLFIPTLLYGGYPFILNDPYSFYYVPGYSTNYASRYVNYTLSSIAKGYIYSRDLLTIAGVKYVIITKPNLTWFREGTRVLGAPLQPWEFQEPPTFLNSQLIGNITYFENFFSSLGFRVIYNTTSFIIYENPQKVSMSLLTTNGVYFVGPLEEFGSLASIPYFNPINDTVFLSPQFNLSLAKFFDGIIMYNPNISIMYKLVANQKVLTRNIMYIFNLTGNNSAYPIYIPSGNWTFAIGSIPILVNPSMYSLNLDTGSTFIINRNSFKPARYPPIYDFDNANYYFYTEKGGNFTIEIKGSGSVGAYIGYNVSISNLTTNLHYINLPGSGIISIHLPPKSVFEPLIKGFNPSMGQMIQDNISSLIISPSSLRTITIDGETIFKKNNLGTFTVYEPINMMAGKHIIKIGKTYGLLVMYNTKSLKNFFQTSNKLSYTLLSNSFSYLFNIHTNSTIIYISLSFSFDKEWHAKVENSNLIHFPSFYYENGFILNRSSSFQIVEIYLLPSLFEIFFAVQQIIFFVILVVLTILNLKKIIRF